MTTTIGEFTIERQIGKGSFGKVYIAKTKEGKVVSLKVEHEGHEDRSILKHEYEIYKQIRQIDRRSKPCIPEVYWFGRVDNKTVLSMQCLGNSLDFLLTHRCKGKFSEKTTLMLAIQMLDLMGTLHCCGIIHRDIKPDNFLIGVGENKQRLYVIDFGLAKVFKRTGHIKEVTGKSLVGTARYASVNSHLGLELSRRDDLESIGYLWVYFMKGRLPWQGIHESDKKKKYALIGQKKQSTSIETLCSGLPKVFEFYFRYVKELPFKQRPNYAMLRKLFVDFFLHEGYYYDAFDWDS